MAVLEAPKNSSTGIIQYDNPPHVPNSGPLVGACIRYLGRISWRDWATITRTSSQLFVHKPKRFFERFYTYELNYTYLYLLAFLPVIPT